MSNRESDGAQQRGRTTQDDERPFWTLKPYHNVAHDIEQFTAELGREATHETKNLGWIALGGRGTANREEIADTLEAIARNAESLAEQVRELDDPREIREEKYD